MLGLGLWGYVRFAVTVMLCLELGCGRFRVMLVWVYSYVRFGIKEVLGLGLGLC